MHCRSCGSRPVWTPQWIFPHWLCTGECKLFLELLVPLDNDDDKDGNIPALPYINEYHYDIHIIMESLCYNVVYSTRAGVELRMEDNKGRPLDCTQNMLYFFDGICGLFASTSPREDVLGPRRLQDGLARLPGACLLIALFIFLGFHFNSLKYLGNVTINWWYFSNLLILQFIIVIEFSIGFFCGLVLIVQHNNLFILIQTACCETYDSDKIAEFSDRIWAMIRRDVSSNIICFLNIIDIRK